MSSEDVYLSILENYTPTNIPTESALLGAGKKIINESKEWKAGKTFVKGTVKTTSKPKGPKDGMAWHARHSTHSKEQGTFDEFWNGLGVNKAENEMQFIPDIHKVTFVKQLSPNASIWTLYYKFSPPVSPRVFTVLQYTHLDNEAREAYVISIPIDLSGDEELAKKEEKGIKARYVGVEYFKELEDGGVTWSMATTSTPAGSIPSFVVERTLPGQIANDVPHFLEWLHKKRST